MAAAVPAQEVGAGPERCLILGKDPCVTARRTHRRKRTDEFLENGARRRRPNPGPASERRSRSRTKYAKVPPREFETRALRIHVGRRRGPDDRLVRAIPAQEDSTRRSGVSETVWLRSHGVTCLAEGHPPTIEEGVEPVRGVVRSPASTGVRRQAPEREYRKVLRRHDVVVETRAPKLDKARMLPSDRTGPLDSRMDRQQRGARHGVLQPGPGSSSE